MILDRVRPPTEAVAEQLRELVRAGIAPCARRLADFPPRVLEGLAGQLVRKSAAALGAVGRIKAAYRMTGKEAPTAPSE